MVERTVMIDGREWHLKANALIPRMYRFKFGCDLMTDMLRLQQKMAKIEKAKLSKEEREAEQFNAADLTVFENIAWCFIKAAGTEDAGENPDEWLEQLDSMFSVYEVLPVILEMWTESTKTTSVPVKK